MTQVFAACLVAAFAVVTTSLAAAEDGATTKTSTVFNAGEDGYHTYRIPAIVRARNGDLLAFCEGRVHGRGDASDIDLVLKRSTDGGVTWSSMQVIVNDGGNTCGNPAPVVLRPSGEVLLVFTKNDGSTDEGAILRGDGPPRTVWLTRSADHGASWSTPRDISGQTRRYDWRWYATGPGHAIQLASSRIVVPCNHSLGPDPATWFSHIIFSDDGGKTWSIGGIAENRTNESTVAELADGRLYLNMRNYRGTGRRAVAYSNNAGASWTSFKEDDALVEPVCQASSIAVRGSGGRSLLFFSNPASTADREKLTVRASRDGGETWQEHLLLHEGPAAYSDLVVLDANEAACLYECGEEHPYERIVFSRFPVSAW